MNPIRSILAVLVIGVLAGCATTTVVTNPPREVLAPLDGTHWQLVGADRGPLGELQAAARKVTLGFVEGRAYGNAGCNRYFSSYEIVGERLILGEAGTTKMYCAGEADEVERAFLPLLEHPLLLTRDRKMLELRAGDGTTLRFEPAAAPAMPAQ